MAARCFLFEFFEAEVHWVGDGGTGPTVMLCYQILLVGCSGY